MLLLILVLDDVSRLKELLVAWERVGVRGVTILESTGLARTLERRRPQAAYAGFSQLFGGGRIGHNTLFAVIEDMGTAEAVAAVTEQTLGDLNQPDTGILFVLPVLRAWGIDGGRSGAESDQDRQT